jgi:hypothetical protein
MFWQFSLLLVLGIPLLISIFATITDEAAESGAERFRVGLVARRICVNAHWSLAGFYFGAARGVLFPKAPPEIRDFALFLVLVSIFLGAVGTIALRRSGLLLTFIVIVSTVLFLWFGTRL